MLYPTKPKGGWQRLHQVVVNQSTAQLWEKKAVQKFMNKNWGAIQNNMAEGPKDSQGPFLYQEGGKTYASLPVGMMQNIKQSPLFQKMKQDCQVEGIEIPETMMAKDPITHVLTSQEYLQNVEAGTMPLMNNHQVMKEMAENATMNSQMKFMMMDFRNVKRPTQPTTPQKSKGK